MSDFDSAVSAVDNLTEAQLINLNNAVISRLREVRARKVKLVKMSLNEGDTVRWTGKRGLQVGTVVAIKRKYAHVDVGSGTWRVPMSMLNKVDE